MNKKIISLLFAAVLFGVFFLETAIAGEKTPQKSSEKSVPAVNQVVRFRTNLGFIDVELFPNAAPLTVANFLGYVNRRDYDNSFIHRLVPNFVWQGGGYRQVSGVPYYLPQQPPVVNEFNISNTRGTLAMAKLSIDPNSATNQWFFNVIDNSATLDTQNGGQTVFGRVTNAAGLAVMDRIAALQTYNFESPFEAVPLINYISGPVQDNNFVTIYSIRTVNSAISDANDFDGDGKADYSVFRSSDRYWYLDRSTAGFATVQFGLASDKLAPADYDGDGKTDIAVWREAEGNFYILNSSNNSVRIENFGLAGDKLTVGDWDGDGKADQAVYRDSAVGSQSYFYYRGSLNNPSGNITYLPWGQTGDKSLRGDFDGDGKQDLAVYRASNQTWYIRNSSNNQAQYITFGLATDKFVPADYDGDGKTDIAVWRPSNGIWYILQSSNNQIKYINWGVNTDVPVAADYDGDGKADAAIYRNGIWWIWQSANNQYKITNFGLSSDLPIQAAYLP